MKNTMFLFAALVALSAFPAFEDGEKLIFRGEVPAYETGAFRPFTLPGRIDESDGMVEYRRGHGLAVWCPEDAEPGKVAALEKFMAAPFRPIGSCSVAYVGGPDGERVLRDLGVEFVAFGAANLHGAHLRQVVVLGPGVEKIVAEGKNRGIFDRLVSKRLTVVLPGTDLSVLPYGLGRKGASVPEDAAAATLPALPAFLGCTRHFRDLLAASKGRAYPAVVGGPAWTARSTPAYFAHVKHGSSSILVLNVAPGDVPAAARAPLSRLWCTLFANVNVASGAGSDPLAAARGTAPGLVPRPRKMRLTGGTYRGGAAPRQVEDKSIPAEGYRLTVAADGIRIASSTAAGRFYAEQTLKQLATGDGEAVSCPCVEIEDAPAFAWRGLHLDESRHFFGMDVVKRMIDRMAEHKLNVFHWHLTDSQAWRLRIDAFPKLTDEGSKVHVWSTADRYYRVKPGTKRGDVIGPEYYTKAEIREIVAYAAARHVRVVPEIDFPGHSMVTMRCYPELKCALGEDKAFKLWDHDVCPGSEFTYRFFEKVFDEVCELFPDEYVHIGGDEANMKNWAQCPKCRALVAREKLADCKAALQHRLTRHFADYLAKKGRKVIGWSEVASGGEPPPNAAVMSWKGVALGMPCVLCPAGNFYFDYEQDLPDDPVPNYFWGWATSLERTYSFDGAAKAKPDERRLILGGQANSWTEMTLTEAELEWKVWPRACAVAELFWTDPSGAEKDFAEFAARVERDRLRMIAQGVNVAPVTRIDPVREALKPWIREGPFIESCRIAGALSVVRTASGREKRTPVGWADPKRQVKVSSHTLPDATWIVLRENDPATGEERTLYLKPNERTTSEIVKSAQNAWKTTFR